MSMNKILIVSDSHNNQVLLRQALAAASDADTIFHLGDNYEDLDDNIDLTRDKKVLKVPGIFHPRYLNGSLPVRLYTDIAGWKFLLIHDPRDLDNFAVKADIILYGHTHTWQFKKQSGKYYINPGHLKSNDDKGRIPTFALLEVEKSMIRVIFKNMKNEDIEIINIKRIPEEK
ncbi:MAG: metallophosphoesterase family protein [Candidatus Cloacimonetes bacterium]|nr:metallophosphoesterase family protein [Candidatus Cloacimonadota bacterium]